MVDMGDLPLYVTRLHKHNVNVNFTGKCKLILLTLTCFRSYERIAEKDWRTSFWALFCFSSPNIIQTIKYF